MKITPIKPALTTPLQPVQTEALKRAHGHRGFGYFLDMGLGKTLLALYEFVTHPRCTRMVVFSPNTFKPGWKTEIEKHGFDVDVHVFESAKRNDAKRWIKHSAGRKRRPVLIVNYEALLSASTRELINEFIKNKAVYLAIDESIAIKSNTSKRTKAILAMAPLFEVIRCLTGRPSTQGPHDLWAQLRVIGAYDRNYYGFRNRFCRLGGWQGKEILGSQNEAELQAIMEPFVFYARKVDWLHAVPEKRYTTRHYALGPVLGPRYAEMEQQFLVWVRAQQRVAVSVVIAQYQKLLQIQCGFVHDETGEVQWLVTDKENPRLMLLRRVLEEEVQGKVAIGYAHKAVGVQLKRNFPTAAYIQGGMKPAEVEHQKDLFNKDASCKIILLQVDASKYGHTIVGQQDDPTLACSTMLFYQNSYSLDTRSQLEDRIHRIGQKYDCLYVDLAGTEMDRHMTQALQRKRDIYEAVMEGL